MARGEGLTAREERFSRKGTVWDGCREGVHMASLDKLFESPALAKLQELGTKLQTNKTMSSISGGMMSTMSLILAGAFFMIAATLLNITGVVETTDPIYQFLVTPYNMTLGIMAIVASFSVGYNYTRALGMPGQLANGIVTMSLFLLVAAPLKTVTLEGGSSMTVLDTTYLGSSGFFTAIILPIITVRIIKLCKDHNLAIKMPDVVPQFLSDAFSNVIPLVINLVLWEALNLLCTTFLTIPIPGAIAFVFSIPLGGLNSVPGMFVLTTVGLLCWACGIHGASVIFMVMMPALLQYYQGNAELVAAGQAPVFQPIALYLLAQTAGGSGNVIPLTLLSMFGKSEQLKAVGKAGFVPSLFNISEPTVFGLPIMYNPVIVIPFILNTLLVEVLLLIGFQVGFFQAEYVMIMTSLPIFLNTYLTSMAWQNLLIPIMAFLVGLVVYFPFVKAYDRQLCKQEEERRAEEEAEAALQEA